MDLNKLNVKQLKELVSINHLFKNFSKLKKDALIAGIKASKWYKLNTDKNPDAFMEALKQIRGTDAYKQKQKEDDEKREKEIAEYHKWQEEQGITDPLKDLELIETIIPKEVIKTTKLSPEELFMQQFKSLKPEEKAIIEEVKEDKPNINMQMKSFINKIKAELEESKLRDEKRDAYIWNTLHNIKDRLNKPAKKDINERMQEFVNKIKNDLYESRIDDKQRDEYINTLIHNFKARMNEPEDIVLEDDTEEEEEPQYKDLFEMLEAKKKNMPFTSHSYSVSNYDSENDELSEMAKIIQQQKEKVIEPESEPEAEGYLEEDYLDSEDDKEELNKILEELRQKLKDKKEQSYKRIEKFKKMGIILGRQPKHKKCECE